MAKHTSSCNYAYAHRAVCIWLTMSSRYLRNLSISTRIAYRTTVDCPMAGTSTTFHWSWPHHRTFTCRETCAHVTHSFAAVFASQPTHLASAGMQRARVRCFRGNSENGKGESTLRRPRHLRRQRVKVAFVACHRTLSPAVLCCVLQIQILNFVMSLLLVKKKRKKACFVDESPQWVE